MGSAIRQHLTPSIVLSVVVAMVLEVLPWTGWTLAHSIARIIVGLGIVAIIICIVLIIRNESKLKQKKTSPDKEVIPRLVSKQSVPTQDLKINILLDYMDERQSFVERLGQIQEQRNITEMQRRKDLLARLRQEYTQNNKLDDKQALPKEWVEKRLFELQEIWHQDEYY